MQNEPELSEMIDTAEVPGWVLDATQLIAAADPLEAAIWTDAIANAVGRRANRLIRAQLGTVDRAE